MRIVLTALVDFFILYVLSFLGYDLRGDPPTLPVVGGRYIYDTDALRKELGDALLPEDYEVFTQAVSYHMEGDFQSAWQIYAGIWGIPVDVYGRLLHECSQVFDHNWRNVCEALWPG